MVTLLANSRNMKYFTDSLTRVYRPPTFNHGRRKQEGTRCGYRLYKLKSRRKVVSDLCILCKPYELSVSSMLSPFFPSNYATRLHHPRSGCCPAMVSEMHLPHSARCLVREDKKQGQRCRDQHVLWFLFLVLSEL